MAGRCKSVESRQEVGYVYHCKNAKEHINLSPVKSARTPLDARGLKSSAESG